ncbi:MAG TPA: glycosyltransferase family 39 protein [Solirubrobacteraceae bacterium]|nr:glycosyltransferase family 39 protein [Solirubrobacteraceae bacterium]
MSVGTLTRGAGRRRTGPDAALARAFGTPAGLAVTGLTVLAALLRFTRLGHQGFWFDEANTAQLVHFSPGKMLGQIPKSESTPPLYYCVAWVWARIFGYGEAGLRSLSALAGVAAVPVAYGCGRKLISPRAGVIAAALTACSPLLIWYSQEARSYSLLVLLTASSLMAFAYVRSDPTPRAVSAWVLAAGLALATHYYAVLAVIPEAAWLLAVHRRRRSVQAGVAVVGLCGLALIPLAISQNGTGNANWIAQAPIGRRLGPMFGQFVLGFGSPGYAVLEPLALVLAVLALILLATRSDPLERRGGVLAAGIALAGLVLNLLMIALGIDDLIARNTLAIWMPAAVAVAGGLAARRAQLLGALAAAALCAMGISAAVAVAVDRNLERPDWRVVVHALGAGVQPLPAGAEGRAILVQHYRDLLPLSLYLRRLTFMPRRGADVSELDVVSFTSPRSGGFCWWGSACNLWPSKIQGSYPVPGFHELWRRHALQFTILRLVAAHPVRLTPRDVAAVLRTTRLRNDELLLQRG